MVDRISAKVDFDQVQAALSYMAGPLKDSLAARMLVEGGVLLRDRAKALAPLSDGPYNPTSRGSQARGTLQSAYYLAKDSDNTTDEHKEYKVSWNARIAWWGKLVEFGYFRKFKVHRNEQGEFYSVGEELPQSEWKWVRPVAPLANSISSHGKQAVAAMIERGRKELPELLKEAMK